MSRSEPSEISRCEAIPPSSRWSRLLHRWLVPPLLLTAPSPGRGHPPRPGQALAIPLPAARQHAEPAALPVPALVTSSDGAEMSLQQAGCKDELFPSDTMSAAPSWKTFIFFAWWLQENRCRLFPRAAGNTARLASAVTRCSATSQGSGDFSPNHT